MPTLLEPVNINNMPLKNRIIRSATWEGMCAPDGRPTPKLADFYTELARGGVGLIITGYAFVSPEGKQLPGKMGIHDDHFAADFLRLTDAVHAADGAIAVQLVHAGGQASIEAAGQRPVAPSAVEVPQYPQIPAALTPAQIAAIVDSFGAAAARARQWGFDAVQLHGAHGYLINQFLSPLTNRRTDSYGGDIDHRCRFLMQVFDAVRKSVGNDFPVMIKLNADDFLDGGLNRQDALSAARMLDAAGIDAIEVSAGTAASGKKGPARDRINTPEKEAYNLDLARRIKSEVHCPVVVVGGFRSYDVAEAAIRDHGMDAIAMSRPLIREPRLPNRWQQGDRSPAKCISCNKCFVPGYKYGGIYCMVEKKRSSSHLGAHGSDH